MLEDAPVGIWTRVERLRVSYAWPGYTTGATQQNAIWTFITFDFLLETLPKTVYEEHRKNDAAPVPD